MPAAAQRATSAPTATACAVGARLRALSRSPRHNLIRDPFPPLGEAPFDLILCRNVLIYFDADTVGQSSVASSARCAPAGALVLGVADVLSRARAGTGRVRDSLDPRPARALRRPLPAAGSSPVVPAAGPA